MGRVNNLDIFCAADALAKRWQRPRAVARAFTTEQASRACLFAKEETQQNERTVTFVKKSPQAI